MLFNIFYFSLRESCFRRKIGMVAPFIKVGPLTTIYRLGEPLDLRLAGACGHFYAWLKNIL